LKSWELLTELARVAPRAKPLVSATATNEVASGDVMPREAVPDQREPDPGSRD
jgi:DNA repair protein RecO (recombination protein O)